MKIKLLFALCALSLSAHAQSGGQIETVVALHTDLHDAEQWATLPIQAKIDGSYASGYVTGVADTLSGTVFCAPDRTSAVQIEAIVKKYMADHPEKWNAVTSPALIASALSTAFPCKKP